MGGCCQTCARGLLIIFNIIFWLSGAAILAIGVWFYVDKNISSYFSVIEVDTEDEYFKYATYVLIAFGGFVFLVGFCGCCGAIRQSKCLLGFYVFFLILIIAGEIGAGVLAIIYRTRVEDKIVTLLQDNIKMKYTTSSTVKESWDFVQIELECCGAMGTADYRNVSNLKYGNKDVDWPASCCKVNDKDKAMESPTAAQPVNATACFDLANSNYLHTQGCKDKLMDLVSKYSTVIIGVGIGIGALEIFGIIFAICVCREVDEEK